ncbi:hypothetical protein [Streptomyces parvulus]|uniref:hypothetical protein n=1 Tax=Streptomyces parvulus TaxID=146923 RepID=UPI0034097D05
MAFDDAAIDAWELKASRRILLNLKTLLNEAPMLKLLDGQIRDADAYHRALLAASDGRWREARTDLEIKGLSAADFGTWFRETSATGFAPETMFTAHPEHYVMPDGGMVETIGGHPLRFGVGTAEAADLPRPVADFADPAYPITLAAVMLLQDGTTYAYAVHQMRPTADGVDFALRIVYPAAAPDLMIAEHQEHLAIEFRNANRHAGSTLGITPAARATIGTDSFDDGGIDGLELKAARRALANLKSLLRGDDMLSLIGAQIDAGDAFHQALIAESHGAFRDSQTTLHVEGVSVEDFFGWMARELQASHDDSELTHLKAHPEHYVLPVHPEGLSIVETIGGHLTRFYSSPQDPLPGHITAYHDDAYPTKVLNGGVNLYDGTPVLWSAHQARNTATGSEWNLRIIFAAAAPDSMIAEHQEHLAVEFRNYIAGART